MFPFYDVIKQTPTLTRTTILCSVACVSVLLGGCDVTGADWKNGPVKISEVQKRKAEAESGASEEISRLEKPSPVSAPVQDANTSLPRKLNPKNLFGSNLRSDTDRIDRLERAMQNMRNDFDLVEPSIKRLMAIEADIQNLVGELRKLSNETMEANKAQAMPIPLAASKPPSAKPKAAPKAMQTKVPPPVSGSPEVYDVRIGVHADKTRIVLDTNAKTSFSVDIDNDENIMVVDLPNTKWSAATSKNLGSKIVSSYRVEQSGDGTLLIFALKRSADILAQSEIAGARGAGRRIVIDLR